VHPQSSIAHAGVTAGHTGERHRADQARAGRCAPARRTLRRCAFSLAQNNEASAPPRASPQRRTPSPLLNVGDSGGAPHSFNVRGSWGGKRDRLPRAVRPHREGCDGAGASAACSTSGGRAANIKGAPARREAPLPCLALSLLGEVDDRGRGREEDAPVFCSTPRRRCAHLPASPRGSSSGTP
jgi:hypothetical protein